MQPENQMKQEQLDDRCAPSPSKQVNEKCPICQEPLSLFSIEKATRHVNDCLDLTSNLSSVDAKLVKENGILAFYQTEEREKPERLKKEEDTGKCLKQSSIAQFFGSNELQKELSMIENHQQKNVSPAFQKKRNVKRASHSSSIVRSVVYAQSHYVLPNDLALQERRDQIKKSTPLSSDFLNNTEEKGSATQHSLKEVTPTVGGWISSFIHAIPSVVKSRLKKSENMDIPSLSKPQKPPRPVPFYKIIPNTTHIVDAFTYGQQPSGTKYWLSHFHADHYMGLNKQFTYGPLYCSPVTANLVAYRLKVNPVYLRPLALYREHILENDDDKDNPGPLKVFLMDANHCPGSVVILFQLPNGCRYLHTGDFRADPEMCQLEAVRWLPIDGVFLDTTYLHPRYTFPSQQKVLSFVVQTVEKHIRRYGPALVLVGTYLIGKEKVFMSIAENFQWKLHVQPEKRRVLECQENATINNLLTDDPLESCLHVVSMHDLAIERLITYFQHYRSMVDKRKLTQSDLSEETMEDTKINTSLGTTSAQVWSKLENHSKEAVYIDQKTHSLKKECYLTKDESAVKGSFVASSTPIKMENDFYVDDHLDVAASDRAFYNAHTIENQQTRQRSENKTYMNCGEKNGLDDGEYDKSLNSLGKNAWQDCKSLIAFKPTGWTFKKNLSLAEMKPVSHQSVHLYGIPYSEHSSYDELEMFVKTLKPSQVIPTVNIYNERQRRDMERILDEWMTP